MILTVYQVVSQCRSPNKRGRGIWGAELKYHLMSAKTQCLFEPWKWLGPYLFLFVNALTLYPVNSLRLLFYRLFVGGRFIRGRDKATFRSNNRKHFPFFCQWNTFFITAYFVVAFWFSHKEALRNRWLFPVYSGIKVSAIESANEILWLEISLTSTNSTRFSGTKLLIQN